MSDKADGYLIRVILSGKFTGSKSTGNYSSVVVQACQTQYLSDSPPEVAITGGHNVALVLLHALTDAVVSIRSSMRARQPVDAGILQNQNPTSVYFKHYLSHIDLKWQKKE